MIDVLQEKVAHKFFGSGKITAQDGDKITVDFTSGTSKVFVYPDCFGDFLRLENDEKKEKVASEIQVYAIVSAANRDRLREENMQRAEEERLQVLEMKKASRAGTTRKKSTFVSVADRA